MNDYNAGRAFESAYQHYRARLRDRESRSLTLSGVDLETFNSVCETCEKLLARGAEPLKGSSQVESHPLTLEKLVDYLRELQRSVERHTKSSGRLGYLSFVKSFIP